MIKVLLLINLLSLSLFAKDMKPYAHKHKPCICDKPIIFDETAIEKVFELKGKVYKILKGDETNPTILYVLDSKTKKFVRIKQQ